MAIVPDFLIKRVYQKGSLRQTANSIAFDLKNVIGPGVISELISVQINDYVFTKEAIKFLTQGVTHLANSIDSSHPIHFRLGQEGTLIFEKVQCLKDGLNQIIIELTNPEAGKMRISLSDNLKMTQ